MERQNAVVASQRLLGEMMGCSVDTVRRALRVLIDEKWVQMVRIGRGREAAYIVNDRVAWGQRRALMPHVSVFSAQVLADSRDQEPETLEGPELRRIPVLHHPGEQQLPSGPSDEPPTQPSFDGMEPALPAIFHDDDGNKWERNPVTGEMQRIIDEDDMR